MAASVNDKFRMASGSTTPVPTTLALPKANGATTASLTSATGWNTTTGLDYVMYRRELNTTTGLYQEIAGTRVSGRATLSGTTLSNMTFDAGTEPASGYAADGNTVVICAATAQWADDLVGGLITTVFDQDGTLKAGAVDNAAVLASNVVTTAKILDANVTNAKLATGAGQPGGAWTAWSPTVTNVTIGNGTVSAKYSQVGKTVHFRYRLTFGSTTSITGSGVTITPPVAFSSDYVATGPGIPCGNSICYDTSASARYYGPATTDASGTNTIVAFFYAISGSNVSIGGLTSANPFIWATGDILFIDGTYETT